MLEMISGDPLPTPSQMVGDALQACLQVLQALIIPCYLLFPAYDHDSILL